MRSILTRLAGLAVLAGAQWMVRLGARDAGTVEWRCDGGECSTDDFAGAAPVLSVFAVVYGFVLLIPPGYKRFITPATMAFYAACGALGLVEALEAGHITSDDDSHLLPFIDVTARAMLMVYGGLALLAFIMAALMWRTPPDSTSEPAPAAEAAPTTDGGEADEITEMIAQLALLRASGALSQKAYDIAMAKLQKRED